MHYDGFSDLAQENPLIFNDISRSFDLSHFAYLKRVS